LSLDRDIGRVHQFTTGRQDSNVGLAHNARMDRANCSQQPEVASMDHRSRLKDHLSFSQIVPSSPDTFPWAARLQNQNRPIGLIHLLRLHD
jgi:hypothetical protein